MSEVIPDHAVVEVHQGHEQPEPEPERESVQWRKRPLTIESLFAVCTPLVVAAVVGGVGLWNKSEVAAARMDERLTAQSAMIRDIKSDIRDQMARDREDHKEETKQVKADLQAVLAQTSGFQKAMENLAYMLTHVNDNKR